MTSQFAERWRHAAEGAHVGKNSITEHSGFQVLEEEAYNDPPVAIGRKNWLFVGSDDGGVTNTRFVTLLASCQMHGIEPWGYLRDLLCLLPDWPARRVLELAPVNWQQTLEQNEAQQRLAKNVFRKVVLGRE